MSADVRDSNEAFYRAIREGDYSAMELIWARNRRVTCTHPGWTLLSGREAVMDSWRMILFEQDPPQIWPIDPQVIGAGKTAMVLVTERMGDLSLLASNAFVMEDGAWRMVNHQSQPTVAVSAR